MTSINDIPARPIRDTRIAEALAQAQQRASERGQKAIVDVLNNVRRELPSAQAHVGRIQAQSVDTPDIPQPTPEEEANSVTDFITNALPGLEAKVLAAIADKKVVLSEAVILLVAISQAVYDGMTQLSGATARALVLGLFGYLWTRFLVPVLPIWAKPISGMLYSTIVAGLETAYVWVVKKAKKA